MEQAEFSRVGGGAGVILEGGTKDSTISGSSFSDLSSGAVYVGDTEPMPESGLVGGAQHGGVQHRSSDRR